MPKPKPYRLISLNPEISSQDLSVVNLIESIDKCFAYAAASRNINFVIFARSDVVSNSTVPFPVYPCLSEPSDSRSDSSHLVNLWRSSWNFCDEILRSFDKLQKAEPESYANVFYMYHAHARHIAPAIRLGLKLKGKHTIVLNLYWLHYLYGTGREETSSILRRFIRRTKTLRKQANVHLVVDSDVLAKRLEEDLNEPFQVLPFFAPVAGESTVPPSVSNNAYSVKRLAFPTITVSNSKGVDLVYMLAKRMQNTPVEFITRHVQDSCGKDDLLPDLAGLKNVRIKEAYLSDTEYKSVLKQCDVVLIPYRTRLFYSRTSGIFSDAIYFGKPMVATANTWVGRQVKKYGCGTTFVDGDVDSFHAAVTVLLDNIDTYQRAVLQMRETWLKDNNPGKVVEFLVNYAGKMEPERAPDWKWTLRQQKFDFFVNTFTPLLERDLVPLAWKLNRLGKIVTGHPSGAIEAVPGNQCDIANVNNMMRGPEIKIETRNVDMIEVRLDSPTGPLIYYGPPITRIYCAPQVYDNVFYLLDASSSSATSKRNTLCSANCWPTIWNTPHPDQLLGKIQSATTYTLNKWTGKASGRLKINPGKLILGSQGTTSVLLSWSFSHTQLIEIHLDSPDGTLVVRAGHRGEILIAPWVRNGTRFYLQNASASEPLSPDNTLHSLEVSAHGSVSLPEKHVATEQNLKQTFLRNVCSEEVTGKDAKPEQMLAADEWGIVPISKACEVYLTCLSSRAFIQKYGGKNLVLFIPPHLQDMVTIFEHYPIRSVNSILCEIDLDTLPTTPKIGEIFRWQYVTARGPNYFIHEYTDQIGVAFTRIYLDSVGLDWPSSIKNKPAFPAHIIKSAKNRMTSLCAEPGKTAILAPFTSTIPGIPDAFWEALANMLSEKGMVVCTNVASDEMAIPGTLALYCPLSEIPAIAEWAGYIFTAGKSDLTELLTCMSIKQHIIQSQTYFSLLPGAHVTYNLSKNGLPDNAIYHQYNPKLPAHICAEVTIERAGI